MEERKQLNQQWEGNQRRGMGSTQLAPPPVDGSWGPPGGPRSWFPFRFADAGVCLYIHRVGMIDIAKLGDIWHITLLCCFQWDWNPWTGSNDPGAAVFGAEMQLQLLGKRFPLLGNLFSHLLCPGGQNPSRWTEGRSHIKKIWNSNKKNPTERKIRKMKQLA